MAHVHPPWMECPKFCGMKQVCQTIAAFSFPELRLAAGIPMVSKPAYGILLMALTGASLASLCQAADNCAPLNRDASISRILNDHAGGKVLKVDERQGKNGCIDLEIRILIDGTVKAIVVRGQKAA